MWGWRRKPKCPHNRVTGAGVHFYLGSSPTATLICLDCGGTVTLKLKGIESQSSAQAIGVKIGAMLVADGYRSDPTKSGQYIRSAS